MVVDPLGSLIPVKHSHSVLPQLLLTRSNADAALRLQRRLRTGAVISLHSHGGVITLTPEILFGCCEHRHAAIRQQSRQTLHAAACNPLHLEVECVPVLLSIGASCPVMRVDFHVPVCRASSSAASLAVAQCEAVHAEQTRLPGRVPKLGAPTSRWPAVVRKLTDCTGAGQAATTNAMGGGTSSCCSGVSSSRAPSTTAAVPRRLHGHHPDVMPLAVGLICWAQKHHLAVVIW